MFNREDNFFIWTISKYELTRFVMPALIWCNGGNLYSVNGRNFGHMDSSVRFCHMIAHLYDLLEHDANVDLYMGLFDGKFAIYLNPFGETQYELKLGTGNATDNCIAKVVKYINGLFNPCCTPCFRITQSH